MGASRAERRRRFTFASGSTWTDKDIRAEYLQADFIGNERILGETC